MLTNARASSSSSSDSFSLQITLEIQAYSTFRKNAKVIRSISGWVGLDKILECLRLLNTTYLSGVEQQS